MSVNARLSAKLERGELVIRIGIGTLAFAFEHSPFANSDDPEDGKPRLKVTDKRAFADDVLRQLLEEREDGETAIDRMLDQACEDAVGNGALGVGEASR